MKNATQLPLLGGITPQQFFDQYWQKKPLLIRNALADYHSPIAAEELAGLACEEEVESRLVIEQGGSTPWELLCGPFNESTFSKLPSTHWSLLVQEANRHIPELSSLLEQFSFIPSWWFDDIMISYSPDQGTVGPHYDLYDVFLLQVEGQKRWRIDTNQVAKDNYLEDVPLRIMKTFEAEHDWVLEPGDMLYLPPGVAHYGVAQGDSLTFSIGYRALSQSELQTSFMDYLLEHGSLSTYFTDTQLQPQQHPGEISSDTINKLTQLLQQLPLDEKSVGEWFGRFISEPRNPLTPLLPEQPFTTQELRDHIAYQPLRRNEQCRFHFFRQDKQHIQLFIDGEPHLLDGNQAKLGILLCDHFTLTHEQLTPYIQDEECGQLLLHWVNLGMLYFEDE